MQELLIFPTYIERPMHGMVQSGFLNCHDECRLGLQYLLKRRILLRQILESSIWHAHKKKWAGEADQEWCIFLLNVSYADIVVNDEGRFNSSARPTQNTQITIYLEHKNGRVVGYMLLDPSKMHFKKIVEIWCQNGRWTVHNWNFYSIPTGPQ